MADLSCVSNTLDSHCGVRLSRVSTYRPEITNGVRPCGLSASSARHKKNKNSGHTVRTPKLGGHRHNAIELRRSKSSARMQTHLLDRKLCRWVKGFGTKTSVGVGDFTNGVRSSNKLHREPREHLVQCTDLINTWGFDLYHGSDLSSRSDRRGRTRRREGAAPLLLPAGAAFSRTGAIIRPTSAPSGVAPGWSQMATSPTS